ncbi:response regulator transcription factor [Mesorhizobium sp. SP-1A]|uniref:response regulator transcription factor n=1 Tax=Mesorhizobium sp. SP-1A TaxID=3077840 RepID=UPI0028F70466|nr:response regulator transcription factor [Mesorhizobium sp. SP-1A]
MSGDAEDRKDGAQTIVVVADHTLIRTSVVRFLKYELADWNFVDMVSTDGLSDARGKDVCLVALSVAGRDVRSSSVCDDLETVGREFPKAAVALLSDTDDLLAESWALEMGVRGYFTNSLPIEVALAGVRLVLAGGVFCPHPLATLKYSTESGSGGGTPGRDVSPGDEPIEVGGAARREGVAGFTRREADVLAELQLGHSNKVIAEKLNMSGNTVKMHLQHIMRKLHVQNRTEVVVLLAPKEAAWRKGAVAELSNGLAL